MEEKAVVPQRPLKSPGLAGFLSAIFPFGAGALYNGQYNKALFHLLLFSGLVHTQRYGSGQPFMALFLAAFYFYQIFDNVQSARAINAAGAGEKLEGLGQELPDVIQSGSVFWGGFLIVLGIILILINFEVIHTAALRDFWPVAVIAVGLKLVLDSVAKSKEKK
jgi:TM2 domain-containing membrane protein YozV